jgi:hypothetical protein
VHNVLPKYCNSTDTISPIRVHFVQITYLKNEISGKKSLENWGVPLQHCEAVQF